MFEINYSNILKEKTTLIIDPSETKELDFIHLLHHISPDLGYKRKTFLDAMAKFLFRHNKSNNELK